MNRAQFVVALLVSALAASLILALVAWMTSGTWSPVRVRFQDLVLVFPMVLAAKAEFGRVPALLASFLSYWVIALVFLAWYIRSTGLENRLSMGHE